MTLRVLVTGATGLLGRRVSAVLVAAGLDVFGTARFAAPGVRSADLVDVVAVDELVRAARPDVVVHLAGGAGAGPPVFARNVLPTVHVMEALSRAGSQARVLVAGSAAEYGPGDGLALREDAVLAPTSDYGRAKAAQTALALELGSRLDLPVTVFRPFNVIAHDLPESTPLGSFRKQLLDRAASIRCGRLDLARDFVTAGDVARVLRALVVRPDLPEIVNICSGRAVTLEELIAAAARQLGYQPAFEPVAELLALPAPNRVVGDPTRLAALGLTLDADPARLARALLASADA